MPSLPTPVSFQNKEGCRLFGMLHQPERMRENGVAILLLSPGVKMRVAPHRLYNKMADRFVAMGYPVLRFDFHGLGDAEGEAPDTLLADLYGATQIGRYVDDTIAAMDWMQRTHGISKFIASGLCGGALTGMLAAQHDPRIVSLLALSIPVILDGSNIDQSRYMTMAQLKGTRDKYLMKFRLTDPAVWRSWWRFVTGQSHYSLIFKSLAKPFAAAAASRRPAKPSDPTPEAAPADNTNPHFAPALHRMLASSRRVLLLFAETDRLLFDFQTKYLQRHEHAISRYGDYYDMQIVPQANHIFSFAEWQEEMLRRSCDWLARRAPEHAGVR